ncbi:MAG: hypothetical protein JOZ69_04780, partial [Myxococcales bacterium]|nr:hypothetical protein [Myxococcales bacterium]
EPEAPAPGFREKDHVETWLHRRVCAGAIPLAEAQRVIATDWVRVWGDIGGVEPWDADPRGDPLE